MPQNRPQHEVKKIEGLRTDKLVHQESFELSREALLKKHVGNSARPPESMPSRTGSSVVAGRREAVEQAHERLEQLGDFFSDPDGWRDRAQGGGADLGGYFNDYKLDLASKYGQPEWIKLMDYLEYSEREGGLAGWLDRWSETMNNPTFDNMAEVADEIGTAVAFNKALVSEFLQNPMHIQDGPLQKQGQELLSLLSSVAHEVWRQTREVLNNGLNRPAIGPRLEAVKEAFRRMSEPQARAQEVRRNVQDLMVAERFNVTRGGLDSRSERELGDGLRDWQRGAKDISALIESLRFQPDVGYLDQQTYAFKMQKGYRDIETGIVAAINKCPDGGASAEVFLRELRALVDAMYEYHASVIPQLTDDQAQKALDQLQATLAQQRSKMDAVLATANPVQGQALQAASQGKLRDFWSTRRDALIGQVGDRALRGELDKVFQGGLGPLLDRWASANQADTYGLAWQLVETLRNYRAGTLSVLEKLGTAGAPARSSATQLMDAMIVGVMAGL